MKSNDSDIVFHLCDHDFQKLMSNPQLYLPKRWDGRNFEEELNSLFSIYLHELISLREQAMNHTGISNDGYHEILCICSAIKECVHAYHCGFPTQAYSILESTMEQLMHTPLDIYQKTGQLEELQEDSLFLYRVRKANSGAKYSRKEIFMYRLIIVPWCQPVDIALLATHPCIYLLRLIWQLRKSALLLINVLPHDLS